MGRAAKYSKKVIFESALAILESRGISGLTMSSIAKKLGAPSGSLYHRYASRDELVAELWLDTVEHFQDWYLEAFREGIVAAACSTVSWAREHPQLARLIIGHRREELMQKEWPESTRQRAALLNDKLKTVLQSDVEVYGYQRLTFALVDIPYAAVRRCLTEQRSPNKELEALVEESTRSLLSL